MAEIFKKPERVSTHLSFCPECDKIVPENERYKWCGKVIHYWTKTVNGYNNAGTGRIGYYPMEEAHRCGELREPNAQEYFIHETCK